MSKLIANSTGWYNKILCYSFARVVISSQI